MRQPKGEVATGAEPLVKKVVAILSAGLLIWAGYHIAIAVSAQKRGEVTRAPELMAESARARELLEKEKRDNEESDSRQRMTREHKIVEQSEEINFGRQ